MRARIRCSCGHIYETRLRYTETLVVGPNRRTEEGADSCIRCGRRYHKSTIVEDPIVEIDLLDEAANAASQWHRQR